MTTVEREIAFGLENLGVDELGHHAPRRGGPHLPRPLAPAPCASRRALGRRAPEGGARRRHRHPAPSPPARRADVAARPRELRGAVVRHPPALRGHRSDDRPRRAQGRTLPSPGDARDLHGGWCRTGGRRPTGVRRLGRVDAPRTPPPRRASLRPTAQRAGRRIRRGRPPAHDGEGCAPHARRGRGSQMPRRREAEPGALPGDVVLRAEKLAVGYERDAPLLEGVSLELRRGELVALMGENGAGKSTLVRHFNGLLQALPRLRPAARQGCVHAVGRRGRALLRPARPEPERLLRPRHCRRRDRPHA